MIQFICELAFEFMIAIEFKLKFEFTFFAILIAFTFIAVDFQNALSLNEINLNFGNASLFSPQHDS